jgi:hypothetical protein
VPPDTAQDKSDSGGPDFFPNTLPWPQEPQKKRRPYPVKTANAGGDNGGGHINSGNSNGIHHGGSIGFDEGRPPPKRYHPSSDFYHDIYPEGIVNNHQLTIEEEDPEFLPAHFSIGGGGAELPLAPPPPPPSTGPDSLAFSYGDAVPGPGSAFTRPRVIIVFRISCLITPYWRTHQLYVVFCSLSITVANIDTAGAFNYYIFCRFIITE